MKRIGPGEYEHKGWAISQDEFDGTWWACKDDISEDFLRLKDAKAWIDAA